MAVSSLPERPAVPAAFDWPLCYEAERLLGGYIDAFLNRNEFARPPRGPDARRDRHGVFRVGRSPRARRRNTRGALRAAGFVDENVEASAGTTVFWHPRAMMPRVVLKRASAVAFACGRRGSRWTTRSSGGAVLRVAIRPEVLADFMAAHDLDVEIEGAFGARLRRAVSRTRRVATRFLRWSDWVIAVSWCAIRRRILFERCFGRANCGGHESAILPTIATA